MNKKVFKLVILITAMLLACKSKTMEPVIMFSKDLNTIVVKNIDNKSLLQIKSLSKEELAGLPVLKVYKIENIDEDEAQEYALEGELLLNGDDLEFMPSKPFEKGNKYLTRLWVGVKFGNVEMLLKGRFNERLKPQEQILMY